MSLGLLPPILAAVLVSSATWAGLRLLVPTYDQVMGNSGSPRHLEAFLARRLNSQRYRHLTSLIRRGGSTASWPRLGAWTLGLGVGLSSAYAAAVARLALQTFALALCPLLLVTPSILVWIQASRAAQQQRRRVRSQMPAVLELFALRLGSGAGSPQACLEEVVAHGTAEALDLIREVLVAERSSGSGRIDRGLQEVGLRWGIPELESVAMLLGLNRQYGIALLPGLDALIADLRHRQKSEVIYAGRTAMTKALLPTAVGVLLPFLVILLFPAVFRLFTLFR